jgi:hypothetical protein
MEIIGKEDVQEGDCRTMIMHVFLSSGKRNPGAHDPR